MVQVSVIIPAYNRAKLLPGTLESLSQQTFQDWRAIVVDDHSTDSTFAVAERFSKRDSRFQCRRRLGRRRGANACRKEGVEASDSPYVIFLDSDDLFLPDALAMRVAAADAAPGLDYHVFMSQVFANSPGDADTLWNIFTEEDDLRRFLRMDLPWHTSGPIWKRSALGKIGGFDESLPSFQDWDLHVRALIGRLKYQKISKVDHLYRRPVRETDQLSSQSTRKAEHLQSHRKIFRRAFDMLNDGGAMTPSIRSDFKALYWWLAERNGQIGEQEEALSVWREAREIGVCNLFHRILGEQILERLDRRIGRYLLVFCEKTFRSIYAGMGSATFHPIASDVVPHAKS